MEVPLNMTGKFMEVLSEETFARNIAATQAARQRGARSHSVTYNGNPSITPHNM